MFQSVDHAYQVDPSQECVFQEFEHAAIDSHAKALFQKTMERIALLENEYKTVYGELAYTRQVLANERYFLLCCDFISRPDHISQRSISSDTLLRGGSPLVHSDFPSDNPESTERMFQELRKDFRHALHALGQRSGELHSMLVTEKVVLEQKAKRAKVEVSRFKKKINTLEAAQRRSNPSPDSVARMYAQEVISLRRELGEKETEVIDAKAQLDCYKVWLGEADSTLYLWDDETGVSILALEIEKETLCKDLQLRDQTLSKIKGIVRNGNSSEDSLSQIQRILAELEPFEAQDSSNDSPPGFDKENVSGGSPASSGTRNHHLQCSTSPVTPTSVIRRPFGDAFGNAPMMITSPNLGHMQNKKVRVSSMSNIGIAKREPAVSGFLHPYHAGGLEEH